jgi:hypothetical protein
MRNLLLLFFATGLAADQDRPSFAGVWEGRFRDRVFCVLTVREEGGIAGTLSPGTIELNDDGELSDARPSDRKSAYPIQRARVEARRLLFEVKDDEDDVLRFELRLLGGGTAELRIVGLPMKPIAMTASRR